MSRPQSLPAAACDAKHSHGLLDGGQYRLLGHDHPVDNDIFDAIAGERILLREAHEAHGFPEIFGDDASHKHVRHDGRFDKHNTHFEVASAGEVRGDCSSAEGEAGAFRAARTSGCNFLFSLSFSHGSQIVNDCNSRLNDTRPDFMSNGLIATRRKGFAQITSKRACNTVRQHQPIDDAVFLTVRHPGHQTHLTVDALDIDACGEHISDYDRFRQGRIAVLSHSLISLPLELLLHMPQRDRLGAVPLPAPSHQFTIAAEKEFA